ncbi:MAG: hypothetical protein ABIP29_11605 [Candidatus Eisenbacteria bacterium]
MTDAGKKTTDKKPDPADERPDPVEGGPDTDETRFPRKNTDQNREMRPGAMTRDEIRERTHRNKE